MKLKIIKKYSINILCLSVLNCRLLHRPGPRKRTDHVAQLHRGGRAICARWPAEAETSVAIRGAIVDWAGILLCGCEKEQEEWMGDCYQPIIY